MTRNTIPSLIALLAVGLLLTAALGYYRAFSYLAAAFILSVFAVAAIERGEHERTLAPYTRLIAGLAVLFGSGLTGIWLVWHPGVTTYTYVFGLPRATFIYMLFLWLLPLLGAVYYATSVFSRAASDEVTTEILDEARHAQHGTDLPLSPARSSMPEAEPDGGSE